MKLHITNGDAVLYLFKKAGIVGTQIAWRDALHEGPVPPATSLAELTRIRAEYAASRGYGNAIKLFHEFASRDAVIARAGEFEEVVLWFEHDLYDQLQILQILVILDVLDLEPGTISIVQGDAYLGSLTAEELSALYPRRRTVTSGIISAAKRGWDAFTASDPDALLAHTHIDFHGLPFMRSALRRLCEEYPGPDDGLSRSERQALAAVAQGPAPKPDELFRRAQGREEAAFFGDANFYAVLDDLRSAPAPLIESDRDVAVTTALGRRVLGGDADWLEEGGRADRWIGGVHLTAVRSLRFDSAAGLFRS
ncbi:MAG: hypothetical protein ACYDGM_03345 [Vulcanimicrobiaceae bacterium]